MLLPCLFLSLNSAKMLSSFISSLLFSLTLFFLLIQSCLMVLWFSASAWSGHYIASGEENATYSFCSSLSSVVLGLSSLRKQGRTTPLFNWTKKRSF